MEAVVNPVFWRGRRVLLTGHTGFKGSWLALWLLQLGAEVHGVALPPPAGPHLYTSLGLQSKLASSRMVDVRDGDGLARLIGEVEPQVVLHLAAQPLVRSSYADPLGTWQTNVLGSLALLEALRPHTFACAVVMVTTDKVYDQAMHKTGNEELGSGVLATGFREHDRLGGHDPYSASKAAMELAVASWRLSFCGREPHQRNHLALATARAGNVIGGGDWATDRIVPDAMRALARGETIQVRQPAAVRPWQHVLDPLAGYLQLAEVLMAEALGHTGSVSPKESWSTAWNFGPALHDHCSVAELMDLVVSHWPGQWCSAPQPGAPYEAACLRLSIDRAEQQLGWRPRWPLAVAVERSVQWYRKVHEGADPSRCCLEDLAAFSAGSPDSAA